MHISNLRNRTVKVIRAGLLSLAVVTVLLGDALANDPSAPGSTRAKRKEITRFIKHNPAVDQAYADRALLKMEAGNVYGAIKDYSSALALTATDKTTFLNARGYAFLGVGAYQEALNDFESVLQVRKSEEALYGRAVARYHMDDLIGAIRDLDVVVAELPEHPKALFNRAVVRIELNQVEEAVTDLEQFLVYHPQHPEARHALATAWNALTRKQKIQQGVHRL